MVWARPDWDPEDLDEEERPRGKAKTVPPPPRDDRNRSPVEVELRRAPAASVLAQRLRAYEIWTKNRVYSLDVNMTCFEVIDLASGKANPKHPFVGMRCVGGQLESTRVKQLSIPLPIPGSEAVFQKRDASNRIRLAQTSKVTRVILHVHRVEVAAEGSDRAWGRITSTGA